MRRFTKIKNLTGLPTKLTANVQHEYDKSPDKTLEQDKRLKQNKKVVKI